MESIKERNAGLDILRVLACYMVIQVHAGEFFYIGAGGQVVEGMNSVWVGFYNSLCRTAVPLFVMLSGFFLLPVKEEMNTFFRKRAVRVVVPFVIWCVFYAIYQWVRGQVDLGGAFLNMLKIPVNFGVEVGHLWYIYMLIGLYMFAPIVSPWLKSCSRKQVEYYLVVWGISLFLPYIHLLFPEVLGECYWNQTPLLYYFSGFLGYMLLAFYVKNFWSKRKSLNIPLGFGLITLGYFITVSGFLGRLQTVERVADLELTWGFETINVMMMSLGIFMLLKDIRFRNVNLWIDRLITDISKLSYGIYLVHIMVLNFFYGIFNTPFESAAAKVPLIAVSTFVMSYIIIKLISLLPKSKYIVG